MDMCYPETTDWSFLDEEALEALDVERKALAEAQSWYSLQALCAYRIAVCPITVRPCAARHAPSGSWIAAPVGGGHFPVKSTPTGLLVYGACGCSSNECACTALSAITLPPPVGGVEAVRMDGELIDPERYRVHGLSLVSLDPEMTWPAEQDLRVAADEPGAFSVTYWRGAKPNALLNYAAGILANEFYLAMSSSPKCRLPGGVRTVSRQGVTYDVDTTLFDGGYTRIREVDAVIRLYNPNRLTAPSRVVSPDVGRATTPTFGVA